MALRTTLEDDREEEEDEDEDENEDAENSEDEPDHSMPPPDPRKYPSKQALYEAVQEHAATHGYAFVKAQGDPKRKQYYVCDRHGVYRNTHKLDDSTRVKKNVSTRQVNCPFKIYCVKSTDDPEGPWEVKGCAKGGDVHKNHGPSFSRSSHPTIRKMAMSAEVKDEISFLSGAGMTPKAILARLKQKYGQEIGITPQDVYNMRKMLRGGRRKKAAGDSPIDALMENLLADNDLQTAYALGASHSIKKQSTPKSKPSKTTKTRKEPRTSHAFNKSPANNGQVQSVQDQPPAQPPRPSMDTPKVPVQQVQYFYQQLGMDLPQQSHNGTSNIPDQQSQFYPEQSLAQQVENAQPSLQSGVPGQQSQYYYHPQALNLQCQFTPPLRNQAPQLPPLHLSQPQQFTDTRESRRVRGRRTAGVA